MARITRSQTLTLLQKLNDLHAHEQPDICEYLHDHAHELYRSCLARFCAARHRNCNMPLPD
ncbi:Rop family plasmid primer RNA-binding protein, partial [Escherichia coli]|uniref:Rop family plasmid primer RNA-binding protein n=1 Tax=Escherichia coli TaxID=562 RepID=UPI00098A3261